jgi:hypothetical protein
MAMGIAGTPTLVSGTAYIHKLRLANTHQGIYGTFAVDPFGSDAGPDGPIHEFPQVKICGLKIEHEQNQMAKITFQSVAYGVQYNVGMPDPVTIVTAVTPANGVLTLAAAPGGAKKLTVTLTDADNSVTELILTILGKDRNGNTLTEIYTRSTAGKVWTSTNAFRTITSITASGFTGTAVGDTVAVTTASVVRPVAVADGTLTLDAQPAEPTQLAITVTDTNNSITEWILTIVGTDPDGNGCTEQYTLSLNGKTFTTSQVFSSVISITGSGLTGTASGDTVQVVAANGVNNRNTISAVTYPAERDAVVFAHLESLMVNDQAGAALTRADVVNNRDNDEYMVNKLSVELNLNANKEDVTSRFRVRVEEPISGGAGFAETKVGFSFSKYDTRNHEQLKRQLSKLPQKMKITYVGPVISGGGGAAFKIEIYINNIQFDSGAPAMNGAGVMAFDLSGSAYQAYTTPTGFPTGLKEPIGIDITNTLATDPLA